MGALIWLMVGVIMLTITIWVHRHTYGTIYHEGKYVADLDDRAPFPMWLLLVMVACSLIPIFNIIVFVAGAVMWFTCYFDDGIKLVPVPKWIKVIKEFLTKQV